MLSKYMLLIGAMLAVLFFGWLALAAPDASAPASQPVTKAEPASQPATMKAEEKKAEEPPPVAEQVSMIYEFFKDAKYREGVAALIVLVVFLWRRYLSKLLIGKVPKKYLPFVVAGVGFLASIPVALAAKELTWGHFVVQGLVLSGEAVLFYSTVLKHLLPKVFGEPKVV
jgi:hypothetical protein